MIEPNEFSGENILIPQDWYKYTRQEVDSATKRAGIKNGLETWVKWEQETKEYYQLMFTELMNLGQIDAAMFIKKYITDVSKELEKAQEYHLNKKAIDYNIVHIIEEQDKMYCKYKDKIRYCLT